ncbi:DUF2934 domain-containing protein [Pseudomonas sp. PCH199]|uniref:DUF2934 domain-containing protein n=1 Tax=unclassified Pseudomonas TaxID=196821 RepID=UPI000BD76A7A|nr:MULTISPECIES: DUF2934 domain-containing protein [unclassified Pseudomonas]MCW8279067.1 DUF2934 domain-containing protein [Pseudomonas sp. PCH199]PAM79668.1 hypothetical protein CES87_29850 [Pseudomonas sp. ERMR1:02]
MSTEDKRIREFAYQIWESEGKPEGEEARHWEMARKLAEAEALAPKKSPQAAGSKTAASKPAAGKTLNGKAGEPKAKEAKAKPAAASKVIPSGEKAVEKKPRTARKPPAV